MAYSKTSEAFSGKTFTNVFECKNFSEANQHCINNYDGSLAIADDELSLRALLPDRSLFPTDCEGNYFWIGLKKENGSLVWINEQQPSDYIANVESKQVGPSRTITCSRYAVQPLKKNQNRKNIDLKLSEVDCGIPLLFICEYGRVTKAGTSNSNTSVIIGSVVGGIALVLAVGLLLIIFLLVWKRKRSGTSQCGKNHKPVNDSDCSENSVSSNPVVEPAYLAASESSTAGGLSSEYLSVSERAVPATESDYDHLRRDVQDKEEFVAYAEINRNNKTKSEAIFSERPAYISDASRRERSQGKEISSTVNKLESLSLNEEGDTEIKDLYSTVNKPKQLTSDNDAKTSDV